MPAASDGEGRANEIIDPDGRSETPLKMRARRFPKGTLFVTRTGGGGGYGDPKTRPVEDVRFDVASGLVSPEAAMARYGVAINADMSVDAGRTEPRRTG